MHLQSWCAAKQNLTPTCSKVQMSTCMREHTCNLLHTRTFPYQPPISLSHPLVFFAQAGSGNLPALCAEPRQLPERRASCAPQRVRMKPRPKLPLEPCAAAGKPPPLHLVPGPNAVRDQESCLQQPVRLHAAAGEPSRKPSAAASSELPSPRPPPRGSAAMMLAATQQVQTYQYWAANTQPAVVRFQGPCYCSKKTEQLATKLHGCNRP